MVSTEVCGTLSLNDQPGYQKMNIENKLIPGLPQDLKIDGIKNFFSKKIIKVIEKKFIKYGFDPLETPSFEISENIGSFLAEDDGNPMSDVFSFSDGEKYYFKI